MIIGINALAAFKQPRTGVEEYTYQLIRHLALLSQAQKHHFYLYTPFKQPAGQLEDLPSNFQIKRLRWIGPFWTQGRLSLELFLKRPERLFIPVHVLPLSHPSSVVTIHGLEYEHYPQMYPPGRLAYLRWSTQYAVRRAQRIISISESTKKDLIDFYQVEPEKIRVIHHGVTLAVQKDDLVSLTQSPYLLFIGRLEMKKNLGNLIKAFYFLKKKYHIPHKLILVGQRGYGFKKILKETQPFFKCLNNQIIFTGYLPQARQTILQKADLLVFPSFYEGFGLPILEAQAAGCPVITSNLSAMPEVAGAGALFVDPHCPEEITEAVYQLISNSQLRQELIKRGRENVKKYSWSRCAQETLETLIEE